uniref:Uncharacterized protein n=1 Tax=Spermophilus dauricus TaxID=99837 RepID=A0A8C9P977_SPEDA
MPTSQWLRQENSKMEASLSNLARPPSQTSEQAQEKLKQHLGKSNIQAKSGRLIGVLAMGAIGGQVMFIIQRDLSGGRQHEGCTTRTLLRDRISL